MGSAAFKLPTFEDLLAQIERLPAHLSGEILEPHTIHTMPRPLAAHRRAAGQCYRALSGADEASGGTGWWIEQEPAVRFGDRLANPDIAGWRVERCPEPPDGSPITIVPDFCCEVLSSSTARIDRAIKLPLYARSGVSWVWLIDPELRFVEVFETISDRPLQVDLALEDDERRLPPFGVEISFARFWMPPKAELAPSP